LSFPNILWFVFDKKKKKKKKKNEKTKPNRKMQRRRILNSSVCIGSTSRRVGGQSHREEGEGAKKHLNKQTKKKRVSTNLAAVGNVGFKTKYADGLFLKKKSPF
jgi:hypothetical protein